MVRLTSVAIVLASLVSALATSIDVSQNVTERAALSNTGRATWFYVGLGACGYNDVDSSPVVAISAQVYNNGAECNKLLQITNTATGATAVGQVRDKCMGCGPNDIDLSPSLFQKLGSLDQGVLSVQWQYL